MNIEMGTMMPKTRYACPLCDWTYDEQPPNMVGGRASRPHATLSEFIGDMAAQASLRQVQATEAAFREHFTTHTAKVILEQS